MSAPPSATPPPRWLPPWLALLPAAYVLSPLALLSLPWLRQLPRPAWWVLGFYALSQQLPALFSPEPFLASLLALGRTLLMLGLMGVGVALGDARQLRGMRWGLALVFLTALLYSGLGGTDLVIGRLSHPYMTPITLGLAGALGVWLALFGGGRLWWRLPFALLAAGVLLLSGSRGAVAATLVGALAGYVLQGGRRWAGGLLAAAALLAGGFYLGQRLDIGALTRLGTADATGRDVLWYNVLSVIQSEPWSGVGSYRLGTRLTPPGGTCELFASPSGAVPECPVWLERLGNPWLIAHNVTLQQWAETGPLGVLGLFLLLGTALVAAVQARSALGLAVMAGLLVATVNDNTLLVPSPFFAEVFWMVAGGALTRLQFSAPGVGLTAAGLLAALSLPLLTLIRQPERPQRIDLIFLSASPTIQPPRPYRAFAQLGGSDGDYRAVWRSCTRSCVSLRTEPFNIRGGTSPILTFEGQLFAVNAQHIELLVYPRNSAGSALPLGSRRWEVSR
ncbi:hypothetical protein RDMS_11670 [Deinococcus sp. RL]|uniref:O-antigen ligase family protein n=1 Tax=Deinococcus sp. RL TaxID=1489678 RepID=UPI0004D553D6|nr:O-antigen ligase family protein [Deinococcus sp. RL]KEF33583.1 hypothetical protein RDMS_11670 [Deinococcus sp. RL]